MASVCLKVRSLYKELVVRRVTELETEVPFLPHVITAVADCCLE